MRRVIRFSRYRFVMIGVSAAIILTGIVLLAVKGLNLGIDFRGGLTQQIQIAPVAMTLSASGEAKVEASSYSGERQLLGGEAIGFTVIQGAERQDFRFTYAEYATIRELGQVCASVPGVAVVTVADPGLASARLFPVDFPVDITVQPLALNYALAQGETPYATTSIVRSALTELGQFEIQTLGRPEEQQFMLKMGVPQESESGSAEDREAYRKAIEDKVKSLLGAAFSADQIIIRKTDYVGRTLAGELTTQTISVIAVALVFMLIYLSFRFKFESALACVLCVVHDSAVMVTVGIFLGLEFSTLAIAAILTIIGYSVNDTIVIFDRVRENVSLMRDSEETVIFDTSVSQTLGRTIITSVVTLLAVIAMFVFTSGGLKDFSLLLIVGIVVGSYSTIYIASPIVIAWHGVARRLQRRSEAKKFGGVQAPKGQQAEQGAPEGEQPLPAEVGDGGEPREDSRAGQARPAGAEAPAALDPTARGPVVRQQPTRKKRKRR